MEYTCCGRIILCPFSFLLPSFSPVTSPLPAPELHIMSSYTLAYKHPFHPNNILYLFLLSYIRWYPYYLTSCCSIAVVHVLEINNSKMLLRVSKYLKIELTLCWLRRRPLESANAFWTSEVDRVHLNKAGSCRASQNAAPCPLGTHIHRQTCIGRHSCAHLLSLSLLLSLSSLFLSLLVSLSIYLPWTIPCLFEGPFF